jgi:hypothetical protein
MNKDLNHIFFRVCVRVWLRAFGGRGGLHVDPFGTTFLSHCR